MGFLADEISKQTTTRTSDFHLNTYSTMHEERNDLKIKSFSGGKLELSLYTL